MQRRAREVTFRRQHRIPGGRFHRSAGFEQAVDRAVDAEIARVERSYGYTVSRAFIISNCVAFALNVPDIESYEEEPNGTPSKANRTGNRRRR